MTESRDVRRTPGWSAAVTEAGLPVDDPTGPGRRFFSCRIAEEAAGFGGIERHGAHGLLRSIPVPETRRGAAVTALPVEVPVLVLQAALRRWFEARA
ncbi:hypothetical protein D1114_20070 [Cereibacter sphaeroides]|uniref:Uncharacterized protein n=1 Tax=Cereibacter sphaeroides TaxID=1063 RepID=A0AAX1UGH3_CERSP|nr:hypothetical protein [Cereibacter sphaeroides]RHZ91491.1 hypothetical protein D1114_20070 [Cereibacter sphaeroides]